MVPLLAYIFGLNQVEREFHCLVITLTSHYEVCEEILR